MIVDDDVDKQSISVDSNANETIGRSNSQVIATNVYTVAGDTDRLNTTIDLDDTLDELVTSDCNDEQHGHKRRDISPIIDNPSKRTCIDMNTIASQPTRLCSKMMASTQTDMTDNNYTTTTAIVNRMKMAQMLLKQSREQIEKFEKERISLIDLVKMMASELKNFRDEFTNDLHRIRDDQQLAANDFALYHKQLNRGIDKQKKLIEEERHRISLIFDNFEREKRDMKAQLECKKQQLRHSQFEIEIEQRRCDVYKRDMHLANDAAEQLKNTLNDKLYLGANKKCDGCKISERVRNALVAQIADKSNDMAALRLEYNQMRKKLDEKERICQILSKDNQRMQKDNQRLQFEVNAARNEDGRQSTMSWRSDPPHQQTITSWRGETAIIDHCNAPISSPTPVISSRSIYTSVTIPNPSPPLSEPSDGDKNMEVVGCLNTNTIASPTTGFDWYRLCNDPYWLCHQLDGCWQLISWYRNELRLNIDQKLFYAERLEKNEDIFDNAMKVRDDELHQLQLTLQSVNVSNDELKAKLAQMTKKKLADQLDQLAKCAMEHSNH